MIFSCNFCVIYCCCCCCCCVSIIFFEILINVNAVYSINRGNEMKRQNRLLLNICYWTRYTFIWIFVLFYFVQFALYSANSNRSLFSIHIQSHSINEKFPFLLRHSISSTTHTIMWYPFHPFHSSFWRHFLLT